MAGTGIQCPLGHTGDGYRIVRDGWVSTARGRKQLYRCVAADGTGHRLRGPVEAPGVADLRRVVHDVRCPRPGHKDAVVRAHGIRTTGTGTWRRFLCVRPTGDTHTFRVMLAEDVPTAPPPAAPPPACREHPGSKVVRAGTYGARSPRQRYLCTPVDGPAHQFTPPLAREAVTPGQACTRCDELLSPHHGPVTAARHTPWTLVGITRALNDLSLGESYANVSLALRAQRDAAQAHLHAAHGLGEAPAGAAAVPGAHSRRERRNAWRVAADLVEQYSPPLFADVDARHRAAAQARRDANDLLLAADPGAVLEQPLVYVLDELPIWTQPGPGKAKRPSWNVLTVVEATWRPPPDPFTFPDRDTRLRLARAFPRANADAWQLVLAELEVRPDFVVADAGSGLQAALRARYGPTVGVVPSLWHIHTNLRDALLRLPNATYRDGDEKVLVDPLRKHLSLLARDELTARTTADVTDWWDELETIVAALPAPVATVRAQRTLHEPRLVAALPILAANPGVPASNAAVENRIRAGLKPFLDNRAHLFGNQERTNRLLNLLVCREAGAFTDLDALALRIRSMNEATGGWAPAPRQIVDRQPAASRARSGRYESLKSHNVITGLAKAKGIPTSTQAAAAAPPLLLSKPKPQAIAARPIRQWARGLGLPGGVTGPIRGSVRDAYAAAQAGASDEEARAVYERAEADRLARNDRVKKGKWRGEPERARRAELAPIRAWAAAHNITLPANGHIPATVLDAYTDAADGRTSARRPSKDPTRGTR